jgi:hypothetical protein
MLSSLLNEHGANRRRLGRRRLRLFGCASCRLLCDAMTDPRSLAAIEHTERFTDGEVDAAQMAEIERAAHRALLDIELRPQPEGVKRPDVPGLVAAQAAFHLVAKHGKRADWCAWAVFRTPAHIQDLPGLTPDPAQQRKWSDRLRAMAQLLRCLFGNPFRPASCDPAWRTATVVGLAAAAYEGRRLPAGHLDPERLAVLADALEEAGCPPGHDLLLHLRGPGPHVRGCAAVDAILRRA